MDTKKNILSDSEEFERIKGEKKLKGELKDELTPHEISLIKEEIKISKLTGTDRIIREKILKAKRSLM